MGETFLAAGVDFVVCIRMESQVMDKTSILFAKTFYAALFSVCDAE